jgi:hypothetical protein
LESRRHRFPFKRYFHFRFPLPVSWPTFQFPISADVGQCRQCHIPVGHGRKCGGSRWNRVAICLCSKVISTSGFHFRFRGRHLSFRCRPMSDNVGSVIFRLGVVENVGVAVGIASPSISVQTLFPLPVSTSGFVADILVSDVGRCRTMSAVSYSGRAWSKMLG